MQNCYEALQLILNDIDYTAGNCRVNEAVGAVLSDEALAIAKKAVADYREVNSPS